jgi:hypothetical protein
MSLYQMQKFLFDINRDPPSSSGIIADSTGLLDRYELTPRSAARSRRATSDFSMCSARMDSC